MARYIDADAMIKRLEEWNTSDDMGKALYNFALNRINEQPTADVVEVVRCKDCVFNVANMRKDLLDATDYSDITCSYFMTDGMTKNDFCSYGKKVE